MPNVILTKTMRMSSQGVGTISSAGAPVITFNTSNFATQQRLSFWSSAVALSSLSVVTITGTDESGNVLTETITPSTVINTPNLSVNNYLSVSAITINSTPTSIVNIGVSSIGSTPWQITNTCATPFNIGFWLTYASSNATTTAQVDYTGQDIAPVFAGRGYLPSVFSVSTAVSTTGGSTAGVINFPITAWRLTVNTTNSTATSGVTLTAIPAGLGS